MTRYDMPTPRNAPRDVPSGCAVGVVCALMVGTAALFVLLALMP